MFRNKKEQIFKIRVTQVIENDTLLPKKWDVIWKDTGRGFYDHTAEEMMELRDLLNKQSFEDNPSK